VSETFKMWDASTPDFKPPTWLKAVSGYIGGDTPHIWTPQEWAGMGRIKKLPIWVRSNPNISLAWNDGWAILQRLYVLGVPKLSPVVLDLETAVDPAYVLGVHRIIHEFGYLLWVYGSQGFVFGNPACDGYWVATLDGVAQMVHHRHVVATQYVDRGQEDTSLVLRSAVDSVMQTW